jgi:hypothetical protein
MPLGEGEVGTGQTGITYSTVTSCLTVTCRMDDGTYVGGHLSLTPTGGGQVSTEVLPAMVQEFQGRKVTAVKLVGQEDLWNPLFLDETPETVGAAGGKGVMTAAGEIIPGDMEQAIRAKLGLDATVNVTQETRNGDFTIDI